jgi:chromosome segregation ATPase
MTTSRYFIARFAQAFGIVRRNQRMSDASAEMHLLREAEAFLGAGVWEKVEQIEKLSVEYWNLRKLLKERAAVREKLDQCETRLEAAHQERAALLSISPTVNNELVERRTALLASLEEKSKARDRIVGQAREIRRIYDGLKMKLEVLTREANTSPERAEELEQVKARLVELKEQFVSLKEQRLTIGSEIEEGDRQLDVIDQEFDVQRKERREQASATFQAIGEINKELSTLRAEDGLLDTRMRQLHGEIGRFVSRHSHHDVRCAAAVRSHRALADVMRALRRSIALNHKLAGTS